MTDEETMEELRVLMAEYRALQSEISDLLADLYNVVNPDSLPVSLNPQEASELLNWLLAAQQPAEKTFDGTFSIVRGDGK